MARIQLSRAAQDALINAQPRQGAYVATPGPNGLTVTRELVTVKAITANGNLTRYGTIERERIVTARLEEMLG